MVYKATNAENGILIKHFDLGSSIHEPYILGDSVANGNNLRMSILAIPLPVFVSNQNKSQRWYLCHIIFNLFVCLFGNYFQTIGPKWIKFHCLMGVTLGTL